MLRFTEAIYQAVAYADIFDYPLNAQEIYRYLPGVAANFSKVVDILHQKDNNLGCQDGFYTLPGREALAGVREQREQVSARLWPHALRYGKRISRLPFVRMVAVTGALAMNNVDSNGDIDYLIVTEPGHIWLTRAQVLLLGRFTSLRGVTLCPNYLISLRTLVFPDHTLYAAHEVTQMIPIAGLDVYEEIRRQNSWVQKFLPNAYGAPPSPYRLPHYTRRSLSRPTLETIMKTPPVQWLENWEMERKIHKLQREHNDSPESTFSVDVCKGHLHRHQIQTDLAMEERLRLVGNR